MNKEIKELKRIARGNLLGNYMNVIMVFLIADMIVMLIETPFSLMTNEIEFSTQNIIYYIAMLLIRIASVVLTAGQYLVHLNLARTGNFKMADLFLPAKNHANRFILTEILMFVISLICWLPLAGTFVILAMTEESLALYLLAGVLALLSIVLNAYISVTFGLLYFVMNDYEDLSTVNALKYTKNMVSTHRKRYLYMLFSFLGMDLLNILSIGIASVWIQSYKTQTTTLFYLDIKDELDEVGA